MHDGEPEVEELDLDVRPSDEQHVRRLDVAMDDAVLVSVGQPFEDLGAGLERGGVGQSPERIASRSVRPGT